MNGYFFGDDPEAEQGRRRAVEHYADPATHWILLDLGVGPGWTCWEVGAGGGSVAGWLAERVGPDGRVLATDIDARSLLEHPNMEIRRHDVSKDPLPATGFDLIHARFLVEHLSEPERVLRRLASALGPGGWLVVEDAAGLAMSVRPEVPEVERLGAAWESAADSVGWDPTYGRQLVAVLVGCGLSGVEGLSYRRQAPGGPTWEAVRLGLRRLGDRISEHGAGQQDVDRAMEVLADPSYTITGAPIVIAWGRSG